MKNLLMASSRIRRGLVTALQRWNSSSVTVSICILMICVTILFSLNSCYLVHTRDLMLSTLRFVFGMYLCMFSYYYRSALLIVLDRS